MVFQVGFQPIELAPTSIQEASTKILFQQAGHRILPITLAIRDCDSANATGDRLHWQEVRGEPGKGILEMALKREL